MIPDATCKSENLSVKCVPIRVYNYTIIKY